MLLNKKTGLKIPKSAIEQRNFYVIPEEYAISNEDNDDEITLLLETSGGSCAAVAAGECLFALGSDTGGSIRDAKTFAEELEKAQVKVSVKVGEGGKVFGSVSSKEIAEAAKVQLGYDIDKKKIQMKDPIKAVGTTSVAIKLHPKVTAELKIVVEGI